MCVGFPCLVMFCKRNSTKREALDLKSQLPTRDPGEGARLFKVLSSDFESSADVRSLRKFRSLLPLLPCYMYVPELVFSVGEKDSPPSPVTSRHLFMCNPSAG